MKCYNLINDNGRPAANQIVISYNGVTTFESYGTPICDVTDKGKVFLNKTFWDYSRTTLKHLYIFLRQQGYNVRSKKDVEKRIANGEFKLS